MKRIGVKMWRALGALIEILVKRIQYKTRVEDKIDAIIEKQRNLERRQVRVEIILAAWRDDRAVVHSLYDVYKKEFDGNSYIDEFYKEYCKKPIKRSKK